MHAHRDESFLAGHINQSQYDFLVSLVRTKFSPSFCCWNIPSYVIFFAKLRVTNHPQLSHPSHRDPFSPPEEKVEHDDITAAPSAHEI